MLLFVVCRPTFIAAQEVLLKSKDMPSPCLAGGLFFLLHKHETRYPLWLAGFHRSYDTNLIAFKNCSDFRSPLPVPPLATVPPLRCRR